MSHRNRFSPPQGKLNALRTRARAHFFSFFFSSLSFAQSVQRELEPVGIPFDYLLLNLDNEEHMPKMVLAIHIRFRNNLPSKLNWVSYTL